MKVHAFSSTVGDRSYTNLCGPALHRDVVRFHMLMERRHAKVCQCPSSRCTLLPSDTLFANRPDALGCELKLLVLLHLLKSSFD